MSKRMTPEDLAEVLSRVERFTGPNAASGIANHIAALEADLANARSGALEEAAKVCDRFHGYRADSAAVAIRALARKEPKP